METDRDTRGTRVVERDRVVRARGGVSFGSVLTGVVVAYGALFILLALVAVALAATDTQPAEFANGATVDATIGIAIAVVAAQFLSYMWGGYTAGRMGRGAGILNGLLVPIVSLLLGVLVAVVANLLDAQSALNIPFSATRLPAQNDYLINFGTDIGIALLVAMVLGGILGGALGARWHTKLERRAIAESEEESETERTEEHRDGAAPPQPAPPPPETRRAP